MNPPRIPRLDDVGKEFRDVGHGNTCPTYPGLGPRVARQDGVERARETHRRGATLTGLGKSAALPSIFVAPRAMVAGLPGHIGPIRAPKCRAWEYMPDLPRLPSFFYMFRAFNHMVDLLKQILSFLQILGVLASYS